MDERTLRRHINKGRNDIAEWVIQIDPALAERLVEARNRKQLQTVLEEYADRLLKDKSADSGSKMPNNSGANGNNGSANNNNGAGSLNSGRLN